MQGPAIQFDELNLALSGVQILSDISLSIEPGQIHCLIGPNGGGKTSLVRCLLGQMPHSGTIRVDWAGDEAIGRTIGYVPQSLDFDKTLPITVDDFMAMLCNRRRPVFFGSGKQARARAAAALERVGFKAAKHKTKLGSLSGGERQRVLFAQALLPEPALLILDEPMTSLDQIGAERFTALIRELADGGATVVWIAHELALARDVADSVSCISRQLLFSGPSELLAGRSAEELFESGIAAQ